MEERWKIQTNIDSFFKCGSTRIDGFVFTKNNENGKTMRIVKTHHVNIITAK